MEKTKKKKGGWKTFGIVVAVLAVCGLVVGGVAVARTNLPGDKLISPFVERNPDNLIKVDDTYVKSGTEISGVTFDVDKNGVIQIKGEPTEDVRLSVCKFLLPAGTYTFSGIYGEYSKDNDVKLKLLTGSTMLTPFAGNTVDVSNKGNSPTFILDKDTIVEVIIEVAASDDVIDWRYKTIKPVLVEGLEEGKFYK